MGRAKREGSKTIRLKMTSVERMLIERAALAYGMPENRYAVECLKEEGELATVASAEAGDARDHALCIRVPTEVVEQARKRAKALGIGVFAVYMRQRILGGLKRKVPRAIGMRTRGQYASKLREAGVEPMRGRPKRGESLLASAGGDFMAVMLRDAGMLREFAVDVFQALRGCGVEPGDVHTVYEVLKRIARIERTWKPTGRGDSNTPAPAEERLVVTAFTKRYGVVELAEAPPHARVKMKNFKQAKNSLNPRDEILKND